MSKRAANWNTEFKEGVPMLPMKIHRIRPVAVMVAVVGVLAMSGCGTAYQDVSFVAGYQPQPRTFISVGEVVDDAPKMKRGNEHKDFDIAK